MSNFVSILMQVAICEHIQNGLIGRDGRNRVQ